MCISKIFFYSVLINIKFYCIEVSEIKTSQFLVKSKK